jgi:monovalent cation/hydrogen antiporter
VARRIGVPAPILMVLGGIAIGFIPGFPAVQLQPDLVFVVFLPPLLYVASIFAPLRDYKTNARAIGLLAVGLVLATAGAVAVTARVLGSGPWPRRTASTEEAHARAALAEAALALMLDLRARWPSHAELVDRLTAEYEHRAQHAEEHHDGELGAADRELHERDE